MGVAAAGLAAAAIAAGGTMYAADKQKKAAEKGAKQAGKISAGEQLQRNVISDRVAAESQMAQEQLRSSETARGLVMSQMGMPGTYGSTSVGSGEFQTDLGKPRGLEGMRSAYGSQAGGIYGDRTMSGVAEGGQYNRKTGATSGSWEVKGTIDDPFQTATNITNQAQFSAVSSLVGQAVQLGNREGEMWDSLNNSAIGGVMQGAARQQRAAMEQIARGIARGGTARRAGFAMAQKMQVQETINRQLTDGLWTARVNLDNQVRGIIQSNLSFANEWVDNQAGIRDSYTSALTSLQTFWSGISPALLGANSSAAGMAHSANASATDALMGAQATQGQAIAGAATALGGIMMKQVGGVMDNPSSSGTPTTNPYSSQGGLAVG